MNKRKLLAAVVGVVALPLVVLSSVGVRASSHPTEQADLGVARSTQDLEAVVSQPGPLTVETVTGAKWEVDRSGVINLSHPKAKAAGLKDGPEPIEIDFHAIRHPSRGLFIVDTGVEHALKNDPEHAAIRGPVASFMHVEKMAVENDTKTWLAKQNEPLAGVFLTHLHLDHVSGMPDVPSATPIYAGPGETAPRDALNLFSKPIIDRALAGHGAIKEWKFASDPSGAFEGVLDVFGDGTLWALSVPGHTPGSTAYLARTKNGPVLMVGDACHTKWGWEHDVEPGTFSHDKVHSVGSLGRLRAFVAKHPEIDVRLGHQRLK
ncbi:MAG: MBL fold metallo-hydrolase [Polyangiales bacterium]